MTEFEIWRRKVYKGGGMNNIMKANLAKGKMSAFGKDIDITCEVRNELDKTRGTSELCKSIPDAKPYMPRQFPKGYWSVYRPLPRTGRYLAPYFIPTSAWQKLPVWELDSAGHYKAPTKELVKDGGYGLHFSKSRTTQGCIKITKLEDLLFLVTEIINALDSGEGVYLEVV